MLDLARGRVGDIRYRLLPVFSELLKPDPAMAALIETIRVLHASAYAGKITTADRCFTAAAISSVPWIN